MNLRLYFTIAISKLTIKLCRLTKSGGTTLPGKVARKLYPDIIKIISANFKKIMVTGTNGKTTTTKIIGQVLSENGIEYITNKSGANLPGGVITTFIEAVDLFGRCRAGTALIEIDEAAFKVMSSYIEPDILVVTNFFRDQLDRYGELYTTLRGVKEGIERCKSVKLILNADDSLCASLGRDTGRETLYYGFDTNAHEGAEESAGSDATFCIYCRTKYEYLSHTYGHLGSFNCPNCGYHKPETAVTCTKVNQLTSSYTDISLSIGSEKQEEYQAKVNLPGLYNVYNSLAAVSLGALLELPSVNSIKAVESFESGFGRMETISAQGKNIKLILVKNPTGFNQVLNYLLTEDKNMQIAFIINDNLADGTDISWLWDVEFEKLEAIADKVDYFYTSGIRSEDMAVRLKYAGMKVDTVKITKDYTELIETGLSNTPEGHNFYILPTYTAMLDIRNILKEKYGLKEFWK